MSSATHTNHLLNGGSVQIQTAANTPWIIMATVFSMIVAQPTSYPSEIWQTTGGWRVFLHLRECIRNYI